MKLEDVKKARQRAAAILTKAGIAITAREKDKIEIADFGLNDLDHYGLQVVVYASNDRYCAKEIVLFPRQICPEHHHPPINDRNPGKQETFRCRWGIVYLYVEGEPTAAPRLSFQAETRAISPHGAKSSCTPATSTPCRPAACIGSRRTTGGRC
jgi:D-lyxose ketol-isomerase